VVFGRDPAAFDYPVTAIMRPSGFDPTDPKFERLRTTDGNCGKGGEVTDPA